MEALRAAVSAIDAQPGAELSVLLRSRYAVLLRRAQGRIDARERATTESAARSVDADAAVARAAVTAARRRLLALRADGTIGDAAFQKVESELDVEELDLELAHRPANRRREMTAAPRPRVDDRPDLDGALRRQGDDPRTPIGIADPAEGLRRAHWREGLRDRARSDGKLRWESSSIDDEHVVTISSTS